ncbi:MAG: CrcB family protein [Saprospiraceae bacterium]|nr:CrcB family protein [Saprospiraceae bacterium]
MPYLFVFLGGGLGSVVRLAMTRWLSTPETGFPWATFGANVISSFILGWLVNHKIEGNISVSIQFFIMTGFCGGFSTFSTFSHEAFTLLQAGHIKLAFLYMGASMATGLLALFLGLRLSSLGTT